MTAVGSHIFIELLKMRKGHTENGMSLSRVHCFILLSKYRDPIELPP